MLVLERKVGERVVIGDGITLVVVETRHNQVRLGVEAARHVPVYRSELLPLDPAKAPRPHAPAVKVPGRKKGA